VIAARATLLARAGVLWLLVAGPPARATPGVSEPAGTIQLAAVRGRAVATLDLSSLFGPNRQQEFGNGLTNVVEIYTAVLPEEATAPVTIHGRLLEILFDVWEETYTVTIKDPEHPAGSRVVLPSFSSLRSFLSDQRGVDLGPVEALPDAFTVEVRVEVNPISKEQLQRTREYIAAGAGVRSNGSRSVLGAVASFLLREPDAGTDVHVLRSGPFTRSGVPAR